MTWTIQSYQPFSCGSSYIHQKILFKRFECYDAHSFFVHFKLVDKIPVKQQTLQRCKVIKTTKIYVFQNISSFGLKIGNLLCLVFRLKTIQKQTNKNYLDKNLHFFLSSFLLIGWIGLPIFHFKSFVDRQLIGFFWLLLLLLNLIHLNDSHLLR